MSINSKIAGAKAFFANEIVQEFLPCTESAEVLEGKMKIMSEKFVPVLEWFTDPNQADGRALIIAEFADAYRGVLSDYTITNKFIYDFQQSIINRATQLVKEYEEAVIAG
jgi:hypothetical protein